MDFHTVLDISAIIWNEDDYQTNNHQYSLLVKSISKFIYQLETFKPKILMNDELFEQIMGNFPYGKAYELGLYDFEHQAINFLKNIRVNVITYSEIITSDLISIPNLIKPHYSDATKKEVNYLISKIHADTETDNIYFTFQYLWDENEDKLKTQLGNVLPKEYETIICDKKIKPDEELTELDNFFTKFKRIFKHHKKHDKAPHKTREAWENWDPPGRSDEDFISQLSCYDGDNDPIPQKLLDSAFKSGDKYYNYDEDDICVTFQPENKKIVGGLYHGYDEYDENKIPNKVKKHFNK